MTACLATVIHDKKGRRRIVRLDFQNGVFRFDSIRFDSIPAMQDREVSIA